MAGSIYNRRIEHDDKVWQLVDEQGVIASCERDYLDLVIVNEAIAISRCFYKGSFDNGAKPITYLLDFRCRAWA